VNQSMHEHEHRDAHEHRTAHEPAHDHSRGHAAHNPRLFRRRFWLALALTIPVLVFSPTLQQLLNFRITNFGFNQLIAPLFAMGVFFTGGLVFLKSGWQELKARKPGMMALIALALSVAFAYSLVQSIGQLFSPEMSKMDFWWELASLVTIMLLGHWLEMSSVAQANSGLGELAKLLPNTATVIKGSKEIEVPLSELQVGDLVLVRPGSTFPADGIVTKGASTVNESMLTGESASVAKAKGSRVIAATINADSTELGLGALTVRVTAVNSETLLANILRLVAEAQASKSKTQLLADRAAGWLFYVALVSAIATAVAWLVLANQSPSFILERVVTVLVIACPHALGLAIPLVTSITTATAARQGILIRSRVAFELARKVDVVLFDKTGTLTTGERGFVSAWQANGEPLNNTNELLALAAGLEAGSEHSIAAAVLAEAKRRKVSPIDIKDQMVMPGLGISGRIDSARVFIGGPALLTQNGIEISVTDLLRADHANSAGNTVIFVVIDSVLLGAIEIGDQLRASSKKAVFDLQMMRKRVAILSGDAHGVASSVAQELNVTEVFAEVLPHQKADIVKKLQADSSVVAMVGDGVNDAPALAQAEVGIAIGAGTDVAIEAAGIVLVSNDPAGVAEVVKLSQRSYSKMSQNLWWAMGYNLMAIPLAAGVFMPIGLVLTPALGAVLMSLSTIIVAVNAQLLRRRR
jgi:Cu2+-exporting ATPase